MMPAIILVVSLAALLQFFVSYCRSLIAASAKHPLSAEVKDVAGISRTTCGEDFMRVVQLLQLCPARSQDRGEVRAVDAYFRLLNLLRSTLGKAVPSLVPWTEVERAQCAYFAAVALERRIAFNRDLLAQQMNT